MSKPSLGIWLEDDRVATLTKRSRPWQLRCVYEPGVIEQGANRILLSCSLPVSRAKLDASPWIRGLLPEGQHLIALATQAQTTTLDYFGLIQRYGRDLAGAFTIASAPEDPLRWDLEHYSEATLASELRTVADAPGFGTRDDSELSIAGLQNKLLAVETPDGWARPIRGYPSTHIFKLGDGRFPGIVAAEHAGMQLASAVGLTTAETRVLGVDGLEVLAVKRYDRTSASMSEPPRRRHQEDACQALAIDINAHNGRGKYEAFGGPTFQQIATLIDRFGDSTADLPRLLEAAVFTWLIGNADAHGKNISFLIDTAQGQLQLAPLYDTVPTLLWPQLRSTMAMSIAGQVADLTFDHFINEARSWGLNERSSEPVIANFLDRIDAVSIVHNRLAELVGARSAALRAG